MRVPLGLHRWFTNCYYVVEGTKYRSSRPPARLLGPRARPLPADAREAGARAQSGRLLARRSADRDEGYCIRVASKYGAVETVRVLLRLGAKVNYARVGSRSPTILCPPRGRGGK